MVGVTASDDSSRLEPCRGCQAMRHDQRVNRQHDYLLDNKDAAAGARLAALAEVFDPVTFRHLDSLGIAPGCCCWEVGAGAPTVPRWLGGRVGAQGRVLATDIDVGRISEPILQVEVRRHDVGRDDPPAEYFDLVHARLVLVHVVQRQRALRVMIESLKPGGWLLLEDADPDLQPLASPDESGPEQLLANRVRHAFRLLMRQRGVDLAYGRTLPRLFREAGLAEVQADAYFPITGPACAALERATVEQIGGQLVTAGLCSALEVSQHLANLAAGGLDLATAPLVSAWGRRPYPRGRPVV